MLAGAPYLIGIAVLGFKKSLVEHRRIERRKSRLDHGELSEPKVLDSRQTESGRLARTGIVQRHARQCTKLRVGLSKEAVDGRCGLMQYEQTTPTIGVPTSQGL